MNGKYQQTIHLHMTFFQLLSLWKEIQMNGGNCSSHVPLKDFFYL